MKTRLKVYGPNLQNQFGGNFDTYVIDDDAYEITDEGWLIVELPAFEGSPVSGSRPARKPTGPSTVTYPPGQWTKAVETEILEGE